MFYAIVAILMICLFWRDKGFWKLTLFTVVASVVVVFSFRALGILPT